MINAIVADVDGVIVGTKHGVNLPLPHPKIISALKKLHNSGIPVVLCTAKFSHAIKEIITSARLNNPHITDGGALIFNPLENSIIKKHIIPKTLVGDIADVCISNNFYTELFGVEDYYLQTNHVSDFTEKRIRILQKRHTAVDSLLAKVEDIEVIKIIAFVHTEEDKLRLEKLLKPFSDILHTVWSAHPALPNAYSNIITIKGVSKKHATLEVLDYLKIAPEETLGVGDTVGDWKFMSELGYAAVTGESDELREKAKTKGEGHYFFAPSADDDGFLVLVDYFLS